MSNHVYWMLEATINDGKMDDLKSLMADMVEATKNDEPGTLNYEWSLGPDNKTLHVFERYEDSVATMIHIGNFGSKFAERLMSCVTPTAFKLYGNPDQSVLDGVAALGAVVFSSIGGFSR